jgi:hypothetical protein
MRSIYLAISIAALALCSCASYRACKHPYADGQLLQAATELTAAKGSKLCLTELNGADHKTVTNLLGRPQRTHEKEEYLYYPRRKNGSTWLLLVSFDEYDQVCNVFGDELLPKAEQRDSANGSGGSPSP